MTSSTTACNRPANAGPATGEDAPTLPEALRAFRPFDALACEDLALIATRTARESIAEGTVLFREGDVDPWWHCLETGTVELATAAGERLVIVAGTPNAAVPVARLKPRLYTARAATPIRTLKIDAEGLGDIWAATLSDEPDVIVEELGADRPPEPEPADSHRERMRKNGLALPSLPAVAVETCAIIDRDEVAAEEVARALLNDPAIAAKIVRAANSAVFYGQDEIGTCERAVTRLGFGTTRQLVLSFAVRELFRAESPTVVARMKALWSHSTEVSALALVLARALGGFEPGEAQLAGLLHGVGAVPVLAYADRQREIREDPAALAALVERLRGEVGEILLRSWRFPEALITAAREAHDWHRDSGAEADLCDLVLVARMASYLGKPGFVELPPLVQLPAFRRVAGGRMDPSSLLAVIAESEDEVGEVQRLLAE